MLHAVAGPALGAATGGPSDGAGGGPGGWRIAGGPAPRPGEEIVVADVAGRSREDGAGWLGRVDPEADPSTSSRCGRDPRWRSARSPATMR